jgi:hypothetical protein
LRTGEHWRRSDDIELSQAVPLAVGNAQTLPETTGKGCSPCNGIVEQYVNSRNRRKSHQPCGTLAVLGDYSIQNGGVALYYTKSRPLDWVRGVNGLTTRWWSTAKSIAMRMGLMPGTSSSEGLM